MATENWFSKQAAPIWEKHLAWRFRPAGEEPRDIDHALANLAYWSETDEAIERQLSAAKEIEAHRSKAGPAYYRHGQWRYLEIGVAEGHSMRWVLENLKPYEAVGVDPYCTPKGAKAAIFDEYQKNRDVNLADWIKADQVDLHHRHSQQWLAEQVSGLKGEPDRFHLIYVDGDHRARQSMLDLVLSFELLHVGGLLVVDDLNRTFVNGRVNVYFSAKAFEFVYRDWLIKEFEEGRQICWRKRAH